MFRELLMGLVIVFMVSPVLREEPFGKHAILEDPEGNLISMAEIDAEDAYNNFHIIMDLNPNDNEICAYEKSAYPTNRIDSLK